MPVNKIPLGVVPDAPVIVREAKMNRLALRSKHTRHTVFLQSERNRPHTQFALS